MLDLILLLIGLLGFGFAGYLDLKTTEFPDWVPYGMIASVLVLRLLSAVLAGNFSGLIASLESGSLLLGFGLLLYFSKQWGDGDAWLLGVLGFMVPNSLIKIQNSPIPGFMALLLNFFIISFVYIIGYSLVLGARKADVRKIFSKKIREQSRTLIPLSSVFVISYFSFIFFLNSIGGVTARTLPIHISFPFIIVFVLFFMQYSKIIEQRVFRRKVLTKDLRLGDVVVGSKWKGLTEADIKKIRRAKRTVWIKEGVRFAPVFFITLVVSLLVGSLII